MRWLSDSALERLRESADAPDLQETRYRLVDKLGQGGMGEVFRVEDQVLQREVALKVITVTDPDGALAARLSQEARVIARLEHPGIVPVHDAGQLPDGRPYYTMKLVQGKRLDEHVHDVPALADRLRIFLRICDAVAFAHAKGVLHRDLKPSNIMLGPFGEVLVMDWGLSKLFQPVQADGSAAPDSLEPPASQTGHGHRLGTPGYMAPEQTRGDAGIDQRADIYSLGAILKFLATHETSQSVPRAVTAIYEQGMAGEAARRYPAVSQLASDVAHFLDGLPVTAYPESAAARAWRWCVRNRTWLLLILAYLLTRALLIFFHPR
jgi:eukaryotic-like serine/threonine-protein kinase